MSADVWIEMNVCAHCGAPEARGAELNVTYNLSAMLREAGFKGWQAIMSEPANRVGAHILDVLDRMAEDPERWRSMNPENGWGDYDRCLQGRMRKWANACVSAPEGATIGGWL